MKVADARPARHPAGSSRQPEWAGQLAGIWFRNNTAPPARARPAAGIWPAPGGQAAAGSTSARCLVSLGVIVVFGGVGGGLLTEGLPPGAVSQWIMVCLLVTAAGCWALGLSERMRDLRVVVPALVGLGLCGAGLDWPQSDGPGFVIGYAALAGLALRVPRQIALAAGAPVLMALAAAEAHESDNPASTVLAVVLGTGFLFATSSLAAFSRDARARAEDELAREAAMREAREQSATLAERSRLARELHDVLAHCLSGLAVQLEGARLTATATAASPGLVDQITGAHRLARDGMADASRVLQALRGETVPGPGAIPHLVSETASALAVPVTLNVAGTPRPIAQEAGLTAYRTVQEALTNVAKHAGRGVAVTVQLSWAPDQLEVVVSARGGDGERAELPFSGFGLTSMAERAVQHGGYLQAGPVADGGFTVHLRLPLDPAPPAGEAR
jgi:signal transduction histidine kinase